MSPHRLAELAASLADPTRAKMVSALLDGRSRPAGELATLADVTPATASEHLARLVRTGLLRVEARGRHRFFRLAGPEVGEALEALARLLPAPPRQPLAPARLALARARLCYDHLAGRLGVLIADALVKLGWLRSAERAFALTAEGERGFSTVGVDLAVVHASRRAHTRACLDWTERREHLAGALGAALAARALEARWARLVPDSRALTVTPAGERAFAELLGVRGLGHN